MKQAGTTILNQNTKTQSIRGKLLGSLSFFLVAGVALISLGSGSFVKLVEANSSGVSSIGKGEDAPAHFDDRTTGAPSVILVPENVATIQGAIDLAADGSVIIVVPGEYRENISIRGKKISLWSMAGAGQTTILGDGREGPIAFIADSNVSFDGFDLRDGSGENGRGAALERSNGTFSNCRFTGNAGGISAADSQAQFDHCVFAENHSPISGGGVWASKSEVRMSDCELSRNAAGTFGGGLFAANGTIALNNVALLDNRVVSGAWGGGIYADGGTLDVVECSIEGNSSNESGAGIYGYGVAVRIRGTNFERNSASSAASIDGEQSTFDVQDSPLESVDENMAEAVAEPAPLTLASDR